MKKMEQDKKKLLLELNNNETIRNDGENNIFGNTYTKNVNGNNYGDMNFGTSNNNIFGVKNYKEKKNKKKIKKEKKIISKGNNINIYKNKIKEK